jgi:hypothetical protein
MQNAKRKINARPRLSILHFAFCILQFLAFACTHNRAIEQDAPDEAARDFIARRGSVDVVARWSAAREQMRHARVASDAAQPGDSATAQPQFTFLGPGNIGGRTLPLVIDPNEPSTMYAGAVSGGVWKTTNAGIRWDTTSDAAMGNLAVSTLVMSPADTRTLFAGTGEGYFREDVRGTALPLRGDGIFVTHDGAGSWTQLASTANNPDFHWVNDLVVSSHDPHRLYAATRTGVWRSTDEGATWTRVLAVTVKGGCVDLAFRGDTAGDYLFASCGVFEQATVYRTKNAEGSGAWTPILSEPGMSRTSLAIAPSNPSIVYALAARNSPDPRFDQSLLGVFRSSQNGDAGSWTMQQSGDGPTPGSLLLTNPLPASTVVCNDGKGNNSYTPMGWHGNAIAVDPVDPNRVWAASVDVFRSDDGGKTWGVASYWWIEPKDGTTFSHADHHGIVFDPRYDGASNQTLYVTNDGGMYRTDNALAATATGPKAVCNGGNASILWRSLNHHYGVTQFYHGMASQDGLTYLGGAQDNGTVVGTTVRGADGWQMMWGGDGGYVALDPKNPLTLYAESQGGAIVRSTDGGNHFTNVIGKLDTFLFITPFVLDESRLWTAGRRVLRNDGTTWQYASDLLEAQVSALAVRGSFVVAGTTTGRIYTSETATTDLNAVWPSTSPRSGWVASLTLDGSTIYATYAQFGGKHVWKSVDGAKTWTAIDGNLPDLPVHSLVSYNGQLFIGTDLGIFTTADGGASWSSLATFPPVITETLQLARGATGGTALYAFTHGRGAWRAELETPQRRRAGAR